MLFAAVLLLCHAGGRLAAARSACGNMVKRVDFQGQGRGGADVPYVEELAQSDWAPWTYLDGFFGDDSTKGTTNERARLKEIASDKILEVLLPKFCVTGACAMQARSILEQPLESATLKMRFKFGPNFEWVNGGKLPGLCGGTCPTGCKVVTGLDGFSARQMWRPCVWPPESELNTMNCTGGKLVGYVYHMNKVHWCGDDFEYGNNVWNRTYSTPNTRRPVVSVDFFQPKPDEWYTMWSHVAMNTAGPPGRRENYQEDGKLLTWLEGPGFTEPLLVINRRDMTWRRYRNISIDQVYFSVFFGGSSPMFEPQKDETIMFDYLKVWEGECSPKLEPFSETMMALDPTWPGKRIVKDGPTVLNATTVFSKTSVGTTCVDVDVLNEGNDICNQYEVELNIRPSWGGFLERSGRPRIWGANLMEQDLSTGWFLLQAEERELAPDETESKIGVCIKNWHGAWYRLDQLPAHISSHAVCVAGPAATHEPSTAAPIFSPSRIVSRRRGLAWGLSIAVIAIVAAIVGFVVLRRRGFFARKAPVVSG